ncbi:MAG: hypothetical protein E6Y08_17460 [Paenibacillus sp.]|jgi:hypothetical protein|uniref:hypothetical protein n=1 Tax=Paenibacillus sp. TaxID=58172 RepID=UPI00291433F8|nr:hypothetical protein [Paenibacillus sp.]MDU4697598.1 hypothetical protein [Paenibacillus sp.]
MFKKPIFVRLRAFSEGQRPVLLAFGGMLVMALLVLLAFIRPSGSQAKATWIWETTVIEQHPAELLDFVRKQSVDTIFLQIGGGVKPESYRSFIRAAAKDGIRVHALSGHPDWALRERRNEAEAFLKWVIDFNREAKAEERFAGIQLDVEPYLLDRWQKDQEAVVEQWMEGVRAWTEEARYNDLAIGAAVPFWLDQIDHPSGTLKLPLGDWMVDQFDYLAIMAYRDAAGRIYEISQRTLNEADRQDKRVWVGVELGESREGPGISFYEQPLASLNREMKRLEELGRKHDSFAGIAVHSYEAWHNKLGGP